MAIPTMAEWNAKQENRIKAHQGRIKAILAKRADETLTFKIGRMDSEIAFLNSKIAEIENQPYPYNVVTDSVLDSLKSERKVLQMKLADVRAAVKNRRSFLKSGTVQSV